MATWSTCPLALVMVLAITVAMSVGLPKGAKDVISKTETIVGTVTNPI